MRDPRPRPASATAPLASEIVFRPMTEEDLDAVLAIERASFSSPWTAAMFLGELRENPFAVFLVALIDGTIVGYIGGWAIEDELHILSLAVHPARRRQGVGSALVDRLFCSGTGRLARAGLEVRASNRAAMALYQSLGFHPVGRRPGYYTDPREDAVIMEWTE